MDARVGLLLALGAMCRRLFSFDEPCDLADATVAAKHFEIDRRHGERFMATLPKTAGLSVLEIGCGYGGLLSLLIERGHNVVGVDIDERRVAFARERGLEARVGDAHDLPFADESFDLVLSRAVLEHLTDIRQALGEAYRVLRPDASFISQWGPSWLSYNGPHLIKCLSVPWVHLIFSDRTIVAALKRQKREDRWPASYIDYKIADFEAMGRTTRCRLRRAARDAGFEVIKESSWSPRPFKNHVARIPPFDELLPGELTVVLRRLH